MPLASGTRLGPYEIVALIGAGGMGEVYRADDTRLGRTVAVKVLPAHLAANAEFRQRLEREARAVAALNHPHICALYDIGSQDGVDFLVMEFLEGETLAERLKRGPLAADQVLRYAIEVADALEKAQRKGFTHRDLKPGNIMLTKDAGSKLLDFGLAKVGTRASGAGEKSAPTQDALTVAGTLLGTVQYMSPEQVHGKDADARSDIFAFGAVLYEMSTGRRAFEGASTASLIAAILDSEPPAIPTPGLDRVVKTCLAKDPEERWQTARDLRRELERVAAGSQETEVRSQKRGLLWPAAAAVLLIVAAGLAAVLLWRGAGEQGVLKLSVTPPDKASPSDTVVISPDGTRLAFVAFTEGKGQIWLRPLDGLAAQPLPGTDNAILPFWSPDSRFLGFFADGKLKRMDVSSSPGPAQVLCDASNGSGGAWSRDGVIVFSPTRTSPLFRVAASGGEPKPLAALDASRQEVTHRFPEFLPDGRLLYLSRGGKREHTGIRVASLDSSPEAQDRRQILDADSRVVYAPGRGGGPGYLLFVRQTSLMAQPFDAGTLRLSGDAVGVADRLSLTTVVFGSYPFSASTNGLLAYHTGSSGGQRVVQFDRAGKALGTVGSTVPAINVSLSPDGKRMADSRVDAASGTVDLWITELARGVSSRFTFGAVGNRFPVWSPDGSRIAFATDREATYHLYVKAASGASGEELLLKSPDTKYPTDWSSDGRFLLFDVLSPKTARDVWVLPLAGDRKPIPLIQTPFYDTQGQFFPRPAGGRDGAAWWIAYASNESGISQVYVQSFRLDTGTPGVKTQVSTAGGMEPRWRRDGKELYYLALDQKLMAVEVKVTDAFEAGVPRALFPTRHIPVSPLRNLYAASADGQRFFVISQTEEAAAVPITVVVNWQPKK